MTITELAVGEGMKEGNSAAVLKYWVVVNGLEL